MPISKAEFKSAFREVVSLEFSHIPQDENSINYIFSERFNKRMQKLIKSQKKLYWNFVNTAAKRAAVIFVAIITIFTAAFSVKAIREPILKFIKQIYESFTYYSFEGDTTEIITKEYAITQLPEGFEQTNKIQNDDFILTEYTNQTEDVIEFKQMTTEYSIGYFVDNESDKMYIEMVDGIEVQFKERYGTKNSIWIKDGYIFAVDCYGDIDFDIIKQIISSIE